MAARRHQWLRAAAGFLFVVGGLLSVLVGRTGLSVRFLAIAAVATAVILGVVWWTLGYARRETGSEPTTLATWVTLTRAALLAVLAGFLAVDFQGLLAWLPGVLFGVAITLDSLDGAVARAMDATTTLGERLDTEIDASALLIGSLLAVTAGILPAPILAVGLARYAFVAGRRYRRWRGLAVFDLDPSRPRRWLAGAAMVMFWLVLLPVPSQQLSQVIAAVVAVPFLLQFTRDWLVVSGRLDR